MSTESDLGYRGQPVDDSPSDAYSVTGGRAPTLAGVSPSSVRRQGGERLTISGTDLFGLLEIRLGDSAALEAHGSDDGLSATAITGIFRTERGLVDVLVVASCGSARLSQAVEVAE